MRFVVIAKSWDDKKRCIVERVIGSFNDCYCASLFKDAYNNMFAATAYIRDVLFDK